MLWSGVRKEHFEGTGGGVGGANDTVPSSALESHALSSKHNLPCLSLTPSSPLAPSILSSPLTLLASRLCMTIVFVGWSQLPCSSSAIIILLTMLYTRFSGSSNITHSCSRDRLRYWALLVCGGEGFCWVGGEQEGTGTETEEG